MSDWLVVTPTLGTSPWLNETVASVARLPHRCRHVLVCPAAVRADLQKRFPNNQVVSETAGGMYAAINTGMAAVEGWAAMTYLNDDDVICAAGTAAAIARLGRNPGTDVVYGRVRLVDAAGAGQGWLPVAHRSGDLAALLARGVVPIAQPGTWLRAALCQRLQGFDEQFRLAGDLDLFSRAVAAGAGFEYVPHEVASFRLHPGQLSKAESVAEGEKALALAGWRGKAAPLAALLRFRRDNLPVYLDRIRRHGFVSMRRVYRGT